MYATRYDKAVSASHDELLSLLVVGPGEERSKTASPKQICRTTKSFTYTLLNRPTALHPPTYLYSIALAHKKYNKRYCTVQMCIIDAHSVRRPATTKRCIENCRRRLRMRERLYCSLIKLITITTYKYDKSTVRC